MIAIKYCANDYSNWCDIVESSTYIGASLEAMHPFGGFLSCSLMYMVKTFVPSFLFFLSVSKKMRTELQHIESRHESAHNYYLTISLNK